MIKTRSAKWYVADASNEVSVSDSHGNAATALLRRVVRAVAGLALNITVLCALIFSAATVCIIGIGEMNLPTALICLLLNVGLWGASAWLWKFLNPKPTIAKTEVAAKPAIGTSRYWWTNTPLREQNRQRIGR